MPFQRFVKVMKPGVDKADVDIRDVKIGNQVYSYEDRDGRLSLTIKPVVNVAYTGVRDCYRMHWQDSSGNAGFVDLTGDHLVRMLDGAYKRATAIREDMRKGQRHFVLAAGHVISTLRGPPPEPPIENLLVSGPAQEWVRATHWQAGVRFRSSAAGKILGVRFFTHPTQPPTRTVSLWDAESQILLGRRTETVDAGAGWRSISFENPINVVREHNYIASFYIPEGAQYYGDEGPFWPRTRGSLIGLASAWTPTQNAFPGQFDDWNYGVDVSFQAEQASQDIGREDRPTNLLRITGDRTALGVGVNHEIVRFELAGKRLYTYDLEIQDTNNFIANEICCHDGTYV